MVPQTSGRDSAACSTTHSNASPPAKPTPNATISEPVHRLPSQSLSSYLRRLDAAESKFSTRLPSLDMIMRGGVTRGKVTELSGPPGSGKTSIALQVASSAIFSKAKVLWIDTASKVPASRLLQSLRTSMPRDDLNDRVSHLQLASLASLLALFLRPPAYLSSHSLIVIDDLSTLIAAAFASAAVSQAPPQPPAPQQLQQFNQMFPPDAPLPAPTSDASKRQKQEDAATKRIRTITELIARMAQVAERSDAAVLVLTKMVSRIGGGDARMVSSLGEGQHLAGLWTRLILFRNDVALELPGSTQRGRPGARTVTVRGVPHACAVKCAGVNYDNASSVGVFRIVEDGITETREWFDEVIAGFHSQTSDPVSKLEPLGSKKRSTFEEHTGQFSAKSEEPNSDAVNAMSATDDADDVPSQKKLKPMVVYDSEELEDEDFEIDENDLL
ncbi:P-loop containing nucleoside triphosphate hydrolase protein [Lipomyces tetrasporus]|uniref:P-loop containing nucleoside triphosphate hydrolase protein n=1 Tax=Lipomyces tetrasporus TaxID=54092 RepID=A0AAD7VV35_9ASCO|nr:P-loop containing nucleoside triphosphate hydrolase protein [Lipomyces tetrasporus]KAJ8101830.1 P-loop containing nucleoside triphosphate hydrolase protein [Lipomyces tetrasporus]